MTLRRAVANEATTRGPACFHSRPRGAAFVDGLNVALICAAVVAALAAGLLAVLHTPQTCLREPPKHMSRAPL